LFIKALKLKTMLRKAFFLSLLISARAVGQCLIPSYVIPDTVCPGTNISITNSASTAIEFQWDFCPGDLKTTPIAANQGMQGGVNYPQQLKIVKEDGKYYGFNVNVGSTFLSRYEFGDSINNTPVITSFLNDPLMAGLTGIDLVKQGNKYYGFVCSFTNNKVFRLEFDSLTQASPSITDLGLSSLVNPRQVKVIDHMLFVANWQTGDIVRFDFNGDYTNVPTQVLPAIGAFINAFVCDITFDCATGNYIGFASGYGNNTIFRLDFGNSLSNTPTITNADNAINLPQALQILFDNNEWYLAAVTNNNPGKFVLYNFGSSLLNTPTKILDETFGGILSEPIGLQLIKQNGEWVGYAPNNLTWLLTKINFPSPSCNATQSYSNEQSPSSFQYNNGTNGWQYFSLSETNVSNEIVHYYDSVFVYIPPPKALFNYSPACEGAMVSFMDSSEVCSAVITDWIWDFGDGSSSTLQNPQHMYSGTGMFNVNLTVISSSGDSGTVSQNINVIANPVAGISGANTICEGALLSLSDNSVAGGDPIQTYLWDFGDGNSASGSTTTHTYNSSGSFNVTLTVISQQGCSDSISQLQNVLPKPDPQFQVSNTCIGESVQFIDASTIMGDTITQYLWNFGDGNTSNISNPFHTYSGGSAVYSVWLYTTSANNCSDSILTDIKISTKPNPSFSVTPQIVCEGNAVSFSDLSTISNDTISSWYWDFGDLNFSTQQNPVHTYLSSGVYQVNLTVASPTYCDTTISLNVNVIDAPTADFTFINACEGSSVSFTDLSSSAAGVPITSYQWEFGDSTQSVDPNPTHVYNNSGIFTISLLVTDSVGCSSTISKQINIYKKPDAGFVTGKACSGLDVVFADTSKAYNTGIIYWSWNFGNGNTSLNANPVTQYLSAQNYLITLIVNDGNGCGDTLSKFITVNKTPSPNFGYSQTCIGDYMQFTNTTFTTFPFPPTNWLWDFGDNSGFSIVENPGHNYLSSGIYNVSLVATDSMSGCADTAIIPVSVDPKPLANFISTTPCIGVPAIFLDSSSISQGSISMWQWNSSVFGNSNSQNLSQTYTQTGSDTITLVVSSAQGCSAQITKVINVSTNPVAAFTVNTNFGSPPLNVAFTNLSQNASAYVWNFGNGASSNLFNPNYSYIDTGTFVSSLVAINGNGCTDTAYQSINIVIPQVDLWLQSINHSIVNNELKFIATIVNSGNVPLSGYELKVEASDLSPFVELVSDSLLSGQTIIHSLNTYYPIRSEQVPAFYCIEIVPISPAVDINESNNRLCKNLITEFDIIGTSIVDQTLIVTLFSPTQEAVSFQLSDMTGKIMLNESTSISQGLNYLKFELNNFSKGIYILNATNAELSKVKLVLSAR